MSALAETDIWILTNGHVKKSLFVWFFLQKKKKSCKKLHTHPMIQ